MGTTTGKRQEATRYGTCLCPCSLSSVLYPNVAEKLLLLPASLRAFVLMPEFHFTLSKWLPTVVVSK
jgi:hypothetical protein